VTHFLYFELVIRGRSWARIPLLDYL